MKNVILALAATIALGVTAANAGPGVYCVFDEYVSGSCRLVILY